jgi:O-antigen/teichoic acid export membrane protein
MRDPEMAGVSIKPTSVESATTTPGFDGTYSFLRQLWRNDLFQKVSETYATQILNIAILLVTTVLITRSLGPQGRGIYAVAMAVGALGVQLSNAGLHFSNTYHVSQDRSLLSALLGNTLLVSFGLGGLIAVLGWTVCSLEPRIAPVQGTALALGFLWIPFGLALMLTENLLLGIHEVRAYNTVEALNKITVLTLVVALLLAVRPRVEWFLAAGFTALLLSLSAALVKLGRFVHGWPRPSLAVLRSNLPLGLRAYLLLLLSFLVLRIDLLMVKYMLGAEQAGYYSVAATMADICLVLPTAIATVLFPKLCGMLDPGQKLTLVRRVSLGVGLALLFTLLVASILAAPLVTLVFGRPFLPAAAAFVWLTPGILTLGVEVVIVQFLNSLGIPKSVLVVWIVSTVANILGNFWAIPHFGIVGASAVSSISYSLTLILILLIIVRTKVRLARRADISSTVSTEIT